MKNIGKRIKDLRKKNDLTQEFEEQMQAISDAENTIAELKKRISELTGIDNFVINEVGPVIGSHAGPGVLAVFFVSKGR